MINVITTSRYKIHKQSLLKFAEKLLVESGVDFDMVLNIAFIGRRKMKEIALLYKHENVALPVLAFPYKETSSDIEKEKLFGEVVLCYPQVVLLAAERGKTLDDMINKLLAHGISNLLK